MTRLHYEKPNGDLDKEFYDVLDIAIKAIEKQVKQEKYRWHDLRKNPDDLPREDKCYLVLVKEGYSTRYDILSYEGKRWSINNYNGILAWKEIERFGE